MLTDVFQELGEDSKGNERYKTEMDMDETSFLNRDSEEIKLKNNYYWYTF